ncbi:hypothetical protein GCM10007963_03070 [Lutibacter litoralis]|nr:hypothetical protein GCM10007963_03070 [Lutibacter litoralis]
MAIDNKDYKWRPNDNSSSTRLKYDLEAEHWTRAFKSAQIKQQSVSIGESLSAIGIVLNLIASLVLLVVFGLVNLYKWLRS